MNWNIGLKRVLIYVANDFCKHTLTLLTMRGSRDSISFITMAPLEEKYEHVGDSIANPLMYYKSYQLKYHRQKE